MITSEDIKPIRELSLNPELLTQLAYPTRTADYANEILKELEKLGVDSVYLNTEPKPSLKFIGKGYRGIILKASWNSLTVAVKILRVDSGVPDLTKEAEMMKLANSIGIGPRLFDYSNHVILMEYVRGVDLDKWLNQLSYEDADLLKKVLTSILTQARKLDSIHLDHGELSNARRHIIIEEDFHPVILDFGKASLSRKPKNFTSIISYLVFGPHHMKISKMLGVSDISTQLLRVYKENPSNEVFNKIMTSLNLNIDLR